MKVTHDEDASLIGNLFREAVILDLIKEDGRHFP
jgi:hypothetical protein